MPRLQELASAMQSEHLFNKREADLKNAGRFRNGQTSFFDCRYDTDS
jgi:hypothetical protein